MILTQEQEAILNSTGDIKINAVAGSGKTTTIIEYAKTRPKDSKILYLAFNKTVKLEAQRKFSEQKLNNVQVETAHSLAYKSIVFSHNYKISNTGYSSHQLVGLLNLHIGGDLHAEHIVANHILRFTSYFCNSNALKVQDLNYYELISDEKAKAFVKQHYLYIELQTRIFLGKMDRGEIDIIHDFYLKKFQLSKPQLPFHYILFDEGQDASAAMLDIFLQQKATKVIVGDTHQQIYGWRFAVNSLEKTNFKTFSLSTSFRFGKNVAQLATKVLEWKKHIELDAKLIIKGAGENGFIERKAIIARTNLGLLLHAIEYVVEGKSKKPIYFEGNINSYTYADDGSSLYDILNLFNGKKHLIRDELVKQMNRMEDLENYIEKTEDLQLGMMLEVVKEYGNEIPNILKTIKNRHVENNEKHKAEMIFSTVHRCKGMEYDSIELVNDFITEERVERLFTEKGMPEKLNEEINLLYVAITRARQEVKIPETLLPKNFIDCAEIKKIDVKTAKETSAITPYPKEKSIGFKKGPKTSYSEKRTQSRAAYAPWTPDLDEELMDLHNDGSSVKELAEHFGRTKGAIWARIERLEEKMNNWDY